MAPMEAPQPDPAPVRGEVAASLDAWRTAVLAGDSAGLVGLVTEDALFLEPGMRLDRADFAAFAGGLFSSGGR